VNDDLVEVGIDYLTAKFFQAVQQLEEILFHQFMYETMQQRVIKLGLCRGRYPSVEMRDQHVRIGI